MSEILYALETLEKVAIGPRTLSLLTRPSAMRKLDERAITEVTQGMSKNLGASAKRLLKGEKRMTPSRALVGLRAGKNRVLARPTSSATHTVMEAAQYEPTAGQKLWGHLTNQKTTRSVPSAFKDTRAAQSGRKLRPDSAPATLWPAAMGAR